MLGGVDRPAAERRARTSRADRVRPWTGEPGTAGTVAVVGAGKMGLPLAAQFASHGWDVIAVDVNPDVVDAINAGRSHVDEEPGLARSWRRSTRRDGCARRSTGRRRRARRTSSCSSCRSCSTTPTDRTTATWTRRSRRSPRVSTPARPSSSRRPCRSATRATASRPPLERASGLVADRDLFVAFSPERLFSGAVLANLATYPKLVGGVGPASTDRAARFYASVLDAEVVADVLGRGRRVQQARRHHVPRREHRPGQRVRRRRRRASGSTSRRSSPRRTASPTATSTSPASASAATASRSTRTCSSRAPGAADRRGCARR